MDLRGKTAVVTGATGGIGREIVKVLDQEGAKLILVSKTESELQSLIRNLKAKNHKYYVCDQSDQKISEKIAKQISNDNKEINVLIHCAGIGIYKTIEDLTLEDWNKSMNINVNSVFILTKELIQQLDNRDSSIVIGLGSGMGVTGEAERSAYCTSKFALRGLMLSLAEEYKRFKNPKFCLVTLGSVLTSFGPMSFEEKKRDMEDGKGYLTSEWVAKKIVELLKLENIEVEYEFSSPDYNL